MPRNDVSTSNLGLGLGFDIHPTKNKKRNKKKENEEKREKTGVRRDNYKGLQVLGVDVMHVCFSGEYCICCVCV